MGEGVGRFGRHVADHPLFCWKVFFRFPETVLRAPPDMVSAGPYCGPAVFSCPHRVPAVFEDAVLSADPHRVSAVLSLAPPADPLRAGACMDGSDDSFVGPHLVAALGDFFNNSAAPWILVEKRSGPFGPWNCGRSRRSGDDPAVADGVGGRRRLHAAGRVCPRDDHIGTRRGRGRDDPVLAGSGLPGTLSGRGSRALGTTPGRAGRPVETDRFGGSFVPGNSSSSCRGVSSPLESVPPTTCFMQS